MLFIPCRNGYSHRPDEYASIEDIARGIAGAGRNAGKPCLNESRVRCASAERNDLGGRAAAAREASPRFGSFAPAVSWPELREFPSCTESVHSGSPAATRSATFLCKIIPTAGSTESSFFSRPPPKTTQAVPTISHWMAPTYPPRGLVTSSECFARGSRSGSSITLGSPPCSSTIWRNFSSAWPDCMSSSASCFRFTDRARASAQMKHPCGEFEAKLAQIFRAPPAQHIEALLDLERVADAQPQRLVHVGDQRDHFLAHSLAGFNHQLGQKRGVFLGLHERARARFHVQHQPVDALGQLLAHDRGANQVGAFDRAGNVAQRIELAVGRSDFGRLADHGAAARAQHFAKAVERRGPPGSRESIRVCRACRRCAPARGR